LCIFDQSFVQFPERLLRKMRHTSTYCLEARSLDLDTLPLLLRMITEQRLLDILRSTQSWRTPVSGDIDRPQYPEFARGLLSLVSWVRIPPVSPEQNSQSATGTWHLNVCMSQYAQKFYYGSFQHSVYLLPWPVSCGRRNQNVEPLPGALCTPTVPP
jgi:hypothetical protein